MTPNSQRILLNSNRNVKAQSISSLADVEMLMASSEWTKPAVWLLHALELLCCVDELLLSRLVSSKKLVA